MRENVVKWTKILYGLREAQNKNAKEQKRKTSERIVSLDQTMTMLLTVMLRDSVRKLAKRK